MIGLRQLVLLFPVAIANFFGHFYDLEYFFHPRRLTPVGRSQTPACQVDGCQSCTPRQLHTVARAIAVKMIGDSPAETLRERGWGSGILIKKKGDLYTVLTNHHVLASASSPYPIQTPDGRIHRGYLLTSYSVRGQDLALVRFRAEGEDYAIASFHPSSTLKPGDKVFGGGFPRNLDAGEVRPIASPRLSPEKLPPQKFAQFLRSPELPDLGFHLTRGRVSLVAEKPLERGYQIGSTNAIQKGMSGGPLLDRWGRVVGINGMHAYPLWGDPYVYQDGSQPPPDLREKMTHLAFAIPSDRFTELAPEFSPPTAIGETANRFFFFSQNRLNGFGFPSPISSTSCH
ncbi:MAG: S1 family peptidase [Limnospira sp.]